MKDKTEPLHRLKTVMSELTAKAKECDLAAGAYWQAVELIHQYITSLETPTDSVKLPAKFPIINTSEIQGSIDFIDDLIESINDNLKPQTKEKN